MKPLDPRLLPHLAPARRPLAGALVASLASGALVIAQAFAVAGLVVALLDGDGGAARRAAGLLALVVVGRAVAGWVVDVTSARASEVVTTTLRRRLLDAALSLGSLRLSRRRSGELALLATRGVAAVDPYLTRYLPALLVAAILPPLTVLAIATQDLLSAVVVVLTLPLVPVFAILIGLTTRDRADRQWQALSSLSGHFVDVMRGLPTLVSYRRATSQSAAIRRITDRYRTATNATLRLAFSSSAVLELVATISVALVAVTVGLRLSGGSLSLGTALVVLLLAPEAYWPLRRVGAEFHAAAEGTATFERANDLLEEADQVLPDEGTPAPVRLAAPGIALDGVTVGYPGRPHPVLENLSCRIPARGLTAVTGPSGAGKSTLLSVLTGELEPSAGQVLVDGRPVEPHDPVWQARIAWIPQRPWLLPGTIADNVRLGRPDASDADVWAALERVALADLVATLPGGLDESVGEDGAGLSAGERARLALARAVVAERPVVLLDEPTAHLDPLTEQVVADTLVWLAARCTVVVVAHRPALVALADHVITVLAVPDLATPPAAVAPTPLPPSNHAAETPTTPDGHDDAPSMDHANDADHTWLRLWGGSLLGALAAASGVALTATAGWLIARAAEHPPVLMLMVAIVGVRTFGLARPVLRYAERLVSHDVALRLLAERRAAVYDALVPLVPGRLGTHRGDVLSSIVDDVDALVDKYLRVRAPLTTAVLVGLLATAFAAWALPAAALVTAAVTLVGGAAALLVARTGVRVAEPRSVAARGRLGALVVQTLQGAPDLLMWQAGDRALDAVDEAGREIGAAGARSARAVAGGRAAAVLASGLGVLAMAAVATPAFEAGALSGPMLALLLLLPLALLDITSPLSDAGALAVRARAADARLDALADTVPLVADASDAVPLDGDDTTLTAHRVHAAWGERPVLRDLSLELPPGRRVGVVGPSGSGKSTLAALLLRFLDPAKGSVSLGDQDLRTLRLDDVRRTVGLVDDDPHVFASSVRENLRLARPGADDATLVAALRAVRLDGWLAALPGGLDTLVGDGHAHVSGGERARLGLARALLADQPVLVLDEPTAHLDSATARAVTDDLLAAGSGRSVVWITHGTVGLDRMHDVLDLGVPTGPSVPVG